MKNVEKLPGNKLNFAIKSALAAADYDTKTEKLQRRFCGDEGHIVPWEKINVTKPSPKN